MENTRIKGLTILKNGQLLTMNDGPVLKDADLWIENGKIVKISDRKETIPENADVIDISGCVVMPGMIDSHVHYDESYMGDFFLASGVTSVRNMQGFAGHAKWRDEILAGTRRGPYISAVRSQTARIRRFLTTRISSFVLRKMRRTSLLIRKNTDSCG